jgi:predicted phosphodiesterase
MRIFAMSDFHIEKQINKLWVDMLSSTYFTKDAIIVAGDISDNLSKLKKTLISIRSKFAEIFFIPGNHELWIRKNQFGDSIEKFHKILEICKTIDVKTAPFKMGINDEFPVWILPLQSWYVKPEESYCSLFIPRPGDDPSLQMWNDNYFIKWPSFNGYTHAADYFMGLNKEYIGAKYDAPVISFSHFLPRRDLILPTEDELKIYRKYSSHSTFNFTRVAGCSGLESQIRVLRSKIHIYGHQHRNRVRQFEDIWYVSHCLGYPGEREKKLVNNVEQGPLLVWDTNHGINKKLEKMQDVPVIPG